MTVNSEVNRSPVYSGNGSTNTWDFPFKATLASELVLWVRAVDGTLTEITSDDFTVSGLNTDAGGTVTYPTTTARVATGEKLVVLRKPPFLQISDLTNDSTLYAENIEVALDRLVFMTQYLLELGERSIAAPETDEPVDMRLPQASQRALKALQFDADGKPSLVDPGETAATLEVYDGATEISTGVTRLVFDGTNTIVTEPSGGVASISLTPVTDRIATNEADVLALEARADALEAGIDGDDTTIQVRRDTAANWTSGNPTLAAGEIGFETDTDKIKFGDGSSDWGNLAYFTPDPSTAASLARAVVDITTDTTLSSANCTIALSGHAWTFDKLLRISGASGTVDLDPAADVTVGMQWVALVLDVTNAVEVIPGEWTEERTGDLESGDETVTDIDETNLESGFGVSGDGVPGGTTINGAPGSGTFEMSAQATASGDDVVLTFDCGTQGKINGREAAVALLPGLVVITVVRTDFGVELEVKGATDEAKETHGGFVNITATDTVDDQMLGRTVLANHASVAIVLTVEDDATILLSSKRVTFMTNQWLAVERTGAAAVSIDDSAGVTIINPDGTTLSTAYAIPNVGQQVLLQWRAADTWKIIA